jgi:cell division septal protein FtsQ
MPSSGRHILDIKKKGPSRAHARGKMEPMFEDEKTPRPRSSRPPRLKDQRRKTRLITVAVCFFAAIGIVGGLAGVSHLNQLAINDVAVYGAKNIQSEALTASVSAGLSNNGFKLFSRRNMFLYPQSTIEKSLSSEFPRIKTVSLSRESFLAQAVVVTIDERVPYARWCKDDRCFLTDPTGFIFAESAGEAPQKAYVFSGGLAPQEPVGQTFLRGRFYTALALLQALEDAGYVPTGLTVDSEKDFSVQLTNGPRLMLSFDMSIESVLKNIEATLSAEGLREKFNTLEYIDLRFGNRVYFK